MQNFLTVNKMSEENLKLWKLVETTPPAHTAQANVSGQRRTTVKAIYQKERATEVFGIQGVKWGVKVGSENYSRVHLDDGEILLQYEAVMFFDYEGERGELPIAACIMERNTFKRGTENQYQKMDHEAIKKVRTDAMTKGLSELGFNADIFKGWYDQQGYSDYAAEQTANVETEKAEAKAIEEAESYAKWKENELSVYSEFTTVRSVNTACTGHCRKAKEMGDTKGVKAFCEARDNRIKELAEAAK